MSVPPELMQQLAAAGMTEEQLRLLAPRMLLGQQFMEPQHAQGRQVGGTYVAASPIEHLSNAIRQIVGAKMVGDVRGQQQGLLTGQQDARQKYMQAMLTAQQGGSGGTLGQEGGGMARPPDPQAAQQLGMLGAGSNDPGMQHMAQYGLQQQNIERQLEMLKSLNSWRQGSLGIKEQQLDQNERTQTLKPDEFGQQRLVPTHAPKAGASAIPGAVQAAGVGVGNGMTAGAAANPLDTNTPVKEPEQSTGQVQGGDGDVGGFPSAVIDAWTKEWAVTGKPPDIAGVPAGGHTIILREMSKRLARDYPDVSFAKDRGRYASNMTAHKTLTEQYRGVKAFTETAQQNANLVDEAFKKVEDTGIPLANAPVRWVMDKLGGDPGVAKFRMALQVALTEYSKVVSGGTLGQRLTDSQRHELSKGASSGEITVGQWRAIKGLIDQDAANRLGKLHSNIQEIEAEMAGKPATAAAPEAPAAPNLDDLLKKYPPKAGP